MPYANIRGVRLYYELVGDSLSRNTVVLLNGIMASSASWKPLLRPLVTAGYRVLLHDFRGQLRSEKPDKPWDFSEHAEDLQCLMDHTGIVQAHLAGISYGGEAALDAAASFPSRVTSVTAITAAAASDILQTAALNSWTEAAETLRGSEFFTAMIPYIYSPEYIRTHRDLLSRKSRAMDRMGKEYFRGQQLLYRSYLTQHFFHTLSRISCPALVVGAEYDALKPLKCSQAIAREIPGSEYVVIPACGHGVLQEKPRELLTIILGFLVKHAR